RSLAVDDGDARTARKGVLRHIGKRARDAQAGKPFAARKSARPQSAHVRRKVGGIQRPASGERLRADALERAGKSDFLQIVTTRKGSRPDLFYAVGKVDGGEICPREGALRDGGDPRRHAEFIAEISGIGGIRRLAFELLPLRAVAKERSPVI